MQDAPPLPCERKAVAAAGGLIVDAGDGMARNVAEQQRADCAVADEQDVAGTMSRQHSLSLAHDPRLCIRGTLPAAHAEMRRGEELVGDGFNSAGFRKPVAERSFSCMASRISIMSPSRAATISAVSIAFRSPLETICVVLASQPAFAKASVRARPTGLRPHCGTGTSGSICTCGWVR
ncbi:hypothetical protein ABH994_001795 [Bradyrhizobium yuanmingense]